MFLGEFFLTLVYIWGSVIFETKFELYGRSGRSDSDSLTVAKRDG